MPDIERKKKSESAAADLSRYENYNLEDFVAELSKAHDELQLKGCMDITVSISDEGNIYLEGERNETQVEAEYRTKREEDLKISQRQRDLVTYERLKGIFENGQA